MEKRIAWIGMILVVLLIVLEQALQLDSIVKQAYKFVFFVVIPVGILYGYKKTTFGQEYHFRQIRIKELKIPLFSGIFLYFLTLFGYVLFQSIIDPDVVVSGLQERGITPGNYIIASLYLSFVNSFVEEFYFRGFLYQHVSVYSKKAGYLISGGLFSLYHVLVMFAIFEWIMGVLAMIGLMIVGMVLVYMNKTNKSIINSWIVHIFADLAVVTIGLFMIFG